MGKLTDIVARAICRETCAQHGEPPCWEATGEPWPNPVCDDPGCHALAEAVADALSGDTGRLALKETE